MGVCQSYVNVIPHFNLYDILHSQFFHVENVWCAQQDVILTQLLKLNAILTCTYK